jgi:hypothetical protein
MIIRMTGNVASPITEKVMYHLSPLKVRNTS